MSNEHPDDIKKTAPILWKDRKHYLWFPFSFTKYWVQDCRLHVSRGLFNSTYDEALLYKVVDVTLVRSFAQKFFGTGTIKISLRMDKDEAIILENVKHPTQVKNYISNLVEEERRAKNVVGKEFFGTDMHHHEAFDMDYSHDPDSQF